MEDLNAVRNRIISDLYIYERKKKMEEMNTVGKEFSMPMNTENWNNWKDIPVGHKQVMTVMTALRSHTDRFRSELVNARKQ